MTRDILFEALDKLNNKSQKNSLSEAEVKFTRDMLNDPKDINIGAFAKSAVQHEEDAKAEEQRRAEEDSIRVAGSWKLSQIKSSPDYEKDPLQAYFDTLVPRAGKADTVAGEIVRAMMRLLYRDYNDGDRFYLGYGLETCASFAEYLMDNTTPQIREMFINIAENDRGIPDMDDTNPEYSDDLEKISKQVVKYLEANPMLVATPNRNDSREYSTEDIEHMAPTYSYDPDVSSDIIDRLVNDRSIDFSWDDVDEFINSIHENDLRSGYVNRWANDAWTIEDVNIEDYQQLESYFEKWFSSWVDELEKEYLNDDGDFVDEDEIDDVDEAFIRRQGKADRDTLATNNVNTVDYSDALNYLDKNGVCVDFENCDFANYISKLFMRMEDANHKFKIDDLDKFVTFAHQLLAVGPWNIDGSIDETLSDSEAFSRWSNIVDLLGQWKSGLFKESYSNYTKKSSKRKLAEKLNKIRKHC